MYTCMMARAAALGSVVVALAGGAVAQERVDLIAGPFGTGSYVLSNALEQITAANDAGVLVTATETPGLVYNARKLTSDDAMRKSTIMSFTSSINFLAEQGQEPFSDPLPSAMLIANYNLGTVWLATFDEALKTPQDLVGKRIALGTPPQILWTIDPMTVIRDGWGLADDIQIETLGTKEAAQALLNGTVDAAIIGGYSNPETGEFLPSPQTVELMASGRALHHIPWGKDAIDAAVEKSGMPLIAAEVPAGAVDGLETEMASFYDAVIWAAYPDFDEESAYLVTKAIIDHVASFSEYHALGKLMTPSALAYGWEVDRIHPGALKAYREAGLVE